MTQSANELNCSSLCHAISRSLHSPVIHLHLPHLPTQRCALDGDTCPECYNNGIPLPKSRTHDRCGGYDLRSQFRGALLLGRNSARNSNCVAPVRRPLTRRLPSFITCAMDCDGGGRARPLPKRFRRSCDDVPPPLPFLAGAFSKWPRRGKGGRCCQEAKVEGERNVLCECVKTKSGCVPTLSNEIAKRPSVFFTLIVDCPLSCHFNTEILVHFPFITVGNNLDQNHTLKNISKQSIAIPLPFPAILCDAMALRPSVYLIHASVADSFSNLLRRSSPQNGQREIEFRARMRSTKDMNGRTHISSR